MAQLIRILIGAIINGRACAFVQQSDSRPPALRQRQFSASVLPDSDTGPVVDPLTVEALNEFTTQAVYRRFAPSAEGTGAVGICSRHGSGLVRGSTRPGDLDGGDV